MAISDEILKKGVMPGQQPQADTESLYFEDFRVGQRFTSGLRKVIEPDLDACTQLSGDVHPPRTDPGYAEGPRFGKPILQGPFGIAVCFGLLHELGLTDASIVVLLDTNWRYLKPIHVGDTLRVELTITGCRRTARGDEGVVDRHVVMLNQHDECVQEGNTAVRVRARAVGADPVHIAFGTTAWGEALAIRLTEDERFGSATA
ncbi:MAG: MaoC/PaaZ C-terminal domain-containing protein, partial [Haloechinothrix sp.]